MSMRAQILVYCILTLVSFDACFGHRRSCGSKLTARISFICEHFGGYNFFIDDERSPRQRRSIVDECCRKVCSNKNISQYCRNASSKEIPSTEYEEIEYPAAVSSTLKGSEVTSSSTVTPDLQDITHTKEITSEFPPILFGTVPPEYTKSALSSLYYRFHPIMRSNR